jgi:hypothetical protein
MFRLPKSHFQEGLRQINITLHKLHGSHYELQGNYHINGER